MAAFAVVPFFMRSYPSSDAVLSFKRCGSIEQFISMDRAVDKQRWRNG